MGMLNMDEYANACVTSVSMLSKIQSASPSETSKNYQSLANQIGKGESH